MEKKRRFKTANLRIETHSALIALREYPHQSIDEIIRGLIKAKTGVAVEFHTDDQKAEIHTEGEGVTQNHLSPSPPVESAPAVDVTNQLD